MGKECALAGPVVSDCTPGECGYRAESSRSSSPTSTPNIRREDEARMAAIMRSVPAETAE
jgi:hypothetical protein